MKNVAVVFTKMRTSKEFQNLPLLPLPRLPLSTLPSGRCKPKEPPTFALNLPLIPNLNDATTSGLNN